MQRQLLCVFVATLGGCKIHRLPEVPPERDPASEEAPVVPYRPPPDVLTTELSTGDADAKGHEGHEGHKGHGKKEAAPKDAHDHHGHGGEP